MQELGNSWLSVIILAFQNWKFFEHFLDSRTFKFTKRFDNPVTCNWFTPFMFKVYICLFWMHVEQIDTPSDLEHFDQ